MWPSVEKVCQPLLQSTCISEAHNYTYGVPKAGHFRTQTCILPRENNTGFTKMFTEFSACIDIARKKNNLTQKVVQRKRNWHCTSHDNSRTALEYNRQTEENNKQVATITVAIASIASAWRLLCAIGLREQWTRPLPEGCRRVHHYVGNPGSHRVHGWLVYFCVSYLTLRRILWICLRLTISGAARGKGESSPYGWTSKNNVICLCFHCHGTSSYHTTNTLQGRRAKSHVDTQTIQPGLGDFVL